MAINPSTQYPGRVTAPTTAFPYGSSKNETSPGAGDGTPYEKARADDILGFQQALLKAASIVPSGSADEVQDSQYLRALSRLSSGIFGNYIDSGAADAYIATPRAAPEAESPGVYYFNMSVAFIPTNINTGGAATVDVDGLGAIPIKLRGGLTNPPAGFLDTSRIARMRYNTSPSPHFELDITGHVQTVTFFAGGAYTPPGDVRSLKIVALGAGGGGGGVDGQGAGTGGAGGGGAGGGNTEITVNKIDATYTITVGGAGIGGAGSSAGTNGGDTTVVSASISLTAPGGAGGSGMTASSSLATASGGLSSNGSGGDVNESGSDGGTGVAAGGDPVLTGYGGGTRNGGIRRGATGNANGFNAVSRGGGGSGATVNEVATNYTGGDGRDGQVVIMEFY